MTATRQKTARLNASCSLESLCLKVVSSIPKYQLEPFIEFDFLKSHRGAFGFTLVNLQLHCASLVSGGLSNIKEGAISCSASVKFIWVNNEENVNSLSIPFYIDAKRNILLTNVEIECSKGFDRTTSSTFGLALTAQ